MSERLIAIGDIHGCSTALRSLLRAIQPQPRDQIVLLGDYIDRGPDSRDVLQQLIDLQQDCQIRAVLGNHDEMLLLVVEGQMPPHHWVRHGGTSTLDSYGFTGDLQVIPREHLDFLRGCEALVEEDNFFFTHANYDAEQPLDGQDPTMLRWTSLDEHMPKPHPSGKTAILGHTANRHGKVRDLKYLKCIDTFCYGGMWLTALDVESGTTWQANESGEVRENADE